MINFPYVRRVEFTPQLCVGIKIIYSQYHAFIYLIVTLKFIRKQRKGSKNPYSIKLKNQLKKCSRGSECADVRYEHQHLELSTNHSQKVSIKERIGSDLEISTKIMHKTCTKNYLSVYKIYRGVIDQHRYNVEFLCEGNSPRGHNFHPLMDQTGPEFLIIRPTI